jgi:hypothetical protein
MSFAPTQFNKSKSSSPSPASTTRIKIKSVPSDPNDWSGLYGLGGIVGVIGILITELTAKRYKLDKNGKTYQVNGVIQKEPTELYVPLMSSFGGLLGLLLLIFLYRNFVMAQPDAPLAQVPSS